MNARDAARVHSLLVDDAWYQMLDPGIRFAVRVLHARGIETGQSCEGGEGHSYDRPTVDLLDGGTRPAGFAALAALEDYGLRVRDVALLWSVDKSIPVDNFWRLTLWQAWPERADEIPMFEWCYRATGGDGGNAGVTGAHAHTRNEVTERGADSA